MVPNGSWPPTAHNELMRARRKREDFRSKLIAVRGAAAAPGDGSTGQANGDGNVPDQSKGRSARVDVYE